MMSTPTETVVEPIIDDGRTFCAVHPTVETALRCNKCGRYMCVRCAVRTPVGYRCKECVHQQQDAFFTATQGDYLIAAAVAFGVSLPISFVITRIDFLLLIIIISFPAGSLIADIANRATGKRRGRYTWMIVAGAIVVSTIVVNFSSLIFTLSHPAAASLLFTPVLYAALCAAGAVARLRYGK
jgi:hypothetical protein